ncbi:M56 family metallopeptidase [Granulicella aggregans]|uniref:M56 family metallopeptidase n=1 Tax=Granulicella aggregans TaxID=474949 RepID=UPI0021DFAE3E|nr:M56 family metallopeptidase [Granulicella aggregans]
MTEQAVVEYVTNCAWQIPLLAAGAWVMVKVARPALRTEHWLWVAVLAMAVVLPMRGVERRDGVAEVRLREERRDAVLLLPVDGSNVRSGGDAAEVRERVAAMSSSLNAGLRTFQLQMSVRATHWFIGLYVAAMLFAGVRLLGAWRRARRLVRESREIGLSAAGMRSLQDVAERMGVGVPEIRESDRIAGPMVVGALRPVLLLPEGAQEYGEEELRAAICHEMAHVKRRDYLVNLLCEAVMVPVSWHPVANAVERRIQQTREMVCDEMAAGEMESGERYARCLVSVTRKIMERPVAYERTQAVGFSDRNTLEERVMRLTGEGEAMTGRSKTMRVVCGGVALAAVVGVAATFHVKPAFGAEATGQSSAAVTAAGSDKTAGALQAQPVKPSAQLVGDRAVGRSEAPVAIARGKHATLTAEPGEYVHRWKSHDGETFAMVNHEAAEPNEEEQQAVEEKLQDVRAGADATVLRLDMPVIKLDMKQLQIDKVQIEKAQRLINDPAMKKQIAELKINPPNIDLSNINLELQLQWQSARDAMNDAQVRGLLDSNTKVMNEAQIDAEIAKGMKGHEAAMAKLQKEMDSGELKAKLEAAQRLLDEVQKKMDAMEKKKQ